MNNESSIASDSSQKKIDPAQQAYLYADIAGTNLTFFNSSLSQSDQLTSIEPLAANSPKLKPPGWACCVLEMENQMSKISLMVLNAWGKSIEAISDEIKNELNSPEYQAIQDIKARVASGQMSSNLPGTTEQEKYLAEVAIADRYAWLQAMGALFTSMIDASKNEPKTSKVEGVAETEGTQINPAPLAVQSLFIIVPDAMLFQNIALVTGASTAVANNMHIESKVIQQAWQAVTPDREDKLAKKIGLFTAICGIGLIYQLSAEKIWIYGSQDNGKQVTRDLAFARTYAERVLGSLSMPQFMISLQAAVANETAQSQSPLGNKLGLLVSKSKLVLLSLALALLTKLELKSSAKDEGWINELDFAGLISGKTDLTLDDVHGTASLKRALIDEIQVILAGLEPNDRDEVLYNLLGYMSRNPSVEELLDQQAVFDLALKPPSKEAELAATPA